MALQLEIISEHREIVGDDAVREFIEDGGTIGRSLQNDWILPDPDKYISGRHATIDYKGGMYYLADVSSNGVYINDEDEPIGKGNPRRLFDGDRLRLGDFEITVSIDRGESIVMPLEEEQTVSPEPLEQAVDEVSLRTGMNLLEEEELTDDEEFESALFSSEKSEDEDFDAFDIAVNEASAIAALSDDEADQAKEVKVTSDDLFDTFLDGLGVNRGDLHPSVDPAEVMQNAGEVLKEFVDGMGKLLYSRANLKTAFKLDQTTVLPRHNNPLKLSENTMDSIMQLLVGREGEYLGPRDAVREVCRDLLFHQDAFLDAMSAAFVEFADRFEPDELKSAFERSIGKKPIFSFLNTLKYWQLYCDLYPVMTEKGGGRFPQMFAEEFVQSYERQINEFKRLDPSDTMLPVPALEPLAEEDFKAEEMTDTFDVLEDSQDNIENHEQDDDFDDESDDDSDDDQAKA
jgi:type VI secretion system FHA domain protein